MEKPTFLWSGYESRSVEAWRLDSFLGARDDKAFYVGQHATGGASVLIQLIGTGAHRAVQESWKCATELRHGHLLHVHATGETTLDGIGVAYAVLDLPEDDLGEVLSRRSLDPNEARSAYTGLASALDYLHRQGLRHGAVTGPNIFLVNGLWKLGADTISPAGDGGRESDFEQLGSLIGTPAEAVVEPRSEIHRATFGRLAAAAAAAAMALITVYLLVHRQTQPIQVTETAAAAPVRESAAAMTPHAPVTAAAGDRNRSAARAAPWAVIAATYANYRAAEKRAAQIHQRSPRLEAQVFPAEGQGKLYFVVLGAGLKKDEAERLRRTALALGAPRDTYVTKLDAS